MLVLCGCERGTAAATEMAESSLLGLAAAVALPLAYAQAVRLGWRLPAALAAAVAGYLARRLHARLSARGRGRSAPRHRACSPSCRPLTGQDVCRSRKDDHAGAALSPFQAMAVRTAIPAIYVLVLGIVQRMAGPGWAGLVSTFPSMSLVVLAVTHLEAGPAEASRIARVLPAGNSSTLAFLAAFHFASTEIGLAGATIAGYAAAVAALLVIERNVQLPGSLRRSAGKIIRMWRSQIVPWRLAIRTKLRLVVFGSAAHAQVARAISSSTGGRATAAGSLPWSRRWRGEFMLAANRANKGRGRTIHLGAVH